MKIYYRDAKLSSANRKRLELINEIIEEYTEKGYTLTLRQLYYQLVSRDVIPNSVQEYGKLSTLLKEGRMAGLVDWSAIEDRLRKPYTPSSWKSPKEILETAAKQFALDHMAGQKTYIEVWVEKDALSGVLKRVTSIYHVPIMVNRGYSSASAMHDSYERFMQAFEMGKKVVILYLGDFDPSGKDMVRDIRERIAEFINGSEEFVNVLAMKPTEWLVEQIELFKENTGEEDDEFIRSCLVDEIKEDCLNNQFEVIPIALTDDQIRRYSPPPNPAKVTDPRAKDYIAMYGNKSWEVDALKPEILDALLRSNIESMVDMDVYESVLETEKGLKDKLKKLVKEFKD